MDQQAAALRILIVDDHPAVRHSLALLLNNHADIRVVGEAADGREALRLVRDLRPDVVVMDVRMPGMDGVQATRRIARDFPAVRVVGMSMDGDLAARRMLGAGAAAHLPKGSDPEAIVHAIRGRRSPLST